jgi:hypothetical protein
MQDFDREVCDLRHKYIEQKVMELELRFKSVLNRLDWIVGLMATTLITVIGALLSKANF